MRAIFLLPILMMAPVFLPTAALRAQTAGAGTEKQKVLMLDFQDAEGSDHFRSTRLADRFKVIARAALPPEKNAWDVRIELAKPNDPQIFLILRKTKKRVLTITVPLVYSVWRNDPAAHKWLMANLILANLGEPFSENRFEREEQIRNHWIVTGLARKAAHSGDYLNDKPFSRLHPGAFAMTSNGIFPGLGRVVHSPADLPSENPPELFSAEYAELLIDALSLAGFFRKRMAEPLLRTALASPGIDPYECFIGVTSELKLKAPGGPDDRNAAADEWFESYVRKTLISLFTPLSVEYFETCYRKTATIRFTDSDGIPRQCRITEIVENWPFFKDANALIDNLVSQLSLLAFQAPYGLQDALAGVRIAIIRCRTEQTPDAADAVRAAERNLFELISKRVAAERLLAAAERRNTTPIRRLDNTIGTLRMLQEDSRTIMPAAQKILDSWDEYK